MRGIFPALAGAAFLVAGVQATPAAATQAVEGRIDANAFGAGVPIDPKQDQWDGAAQIRDLSARSVYNSPTSGIPSAESHAAISAHWASADTGVVDFSDEGISVFQGDRIDDGILAAFGATWEYDFIADHDGVLDFDLNAAFTGVQDDIGFWKVAAVDVTDPTQFVFLSADGYAAGRNTLELKGALRLTAGHSYAFAMSDGGDSRELELPGTLQGNEAGRLDWSITSDAAPVPEPGAWALMLVGFVSGGAWLRRKARPGMDSAGRLT